MRGRRRSQALIRLAIAATAAASWAAMPRAGYAQITAFNSDVDNWRYDAEGAIGVAFDTFYPGVAEGKADLTGPVATLDLGSTQLTITRLDPGGALRDATIPFGACSDAPLYAETGVGCRWEFTNPVYGLYVYYGSLGQASHVKARLYSNDTQIGEITRYGGFDDVYALGHGFVSEQPIDRIDFEKSGAGDAVLIGAYVGLAPSEPSLGTTFIEGYAGPDGPDVTFDFAFTTVKPNPFKLSVGTLTGGSNGQFGVVKGDPNAKTYLFYSMTGLGQTRMPQLNVTLGIRSPLQAGQPRRSDGSGNVNWTLPIPVNARGRDVWFQAAQTGKVTNVVATWIN